MKPYGQCSFSLTEADPLMYWSVEGSFEGFSEPRRAEAETYEVGATVRGLTKRV